jgi:RNA polymerase sigma-70 factor (ECF subfamily)
MLALERLSPLERAAFILHDVFDIGFDEVAGALDRSEAACRQLAARARDHMRDSPPRFAVSPKEASRIAEAFFTAARSGDVAGLRDLLAEDVVLRTDGGGHKPSALRPVLGADKVSRFFAGIARKAGLTGPQWVRRVTINGLPGFATVEPDGTLQTTALDIADGRIRAVYIVRNPDKLRKVRSMLPAFNQK